jgi:hypothetical protein
MVEQELAGIDQCPEDVFEAFTRRVGRLEEFPGFGQFLI